MTTQANEIVSPRAQQSVSAEPTVEAVIDIVAPVVLPHTIQSARAEAQVIAEGISTLDEAE